MIAPLLTCTSGVTLMGGGYIDTADVDDCLNRAPHLVAADGGGDVALALGRQPEAVIGDLDSLSAQSRAQLDPGCVFAIDEQDSTDFEKCLQRVEAPLFLGLGFLGGRFDHALAAMNALVVHSEKRVVLIGQEDLVFAVSDRIELALVPGTRVSLFPMARVRGRSVGLRWPIDGLTFSPDERIGTSNEAEGDVTIETEGPGLLAIMPKAALGAVLSGFGG